MRLFVAVEIDPVVRAGVSAIAESLGREIARLAPRARLTWVAPDRMHLTLRFLGERDERQTSQVRAAVAPPIAVAPFDLSFGSVGAFPSSGPPRVFWLALEEGQRQLRDVEREVTRRFETMGIPREDRPFNPHLTLARVRDAAGLRSGAWLHRITAVEAEPPGASRVDAITLFESRLSPTGPTYVALARTPLV